MFVIRNADTGRFSVPVGGEVYSSDFKKAARYATRKAAEGDCFGSDRVITEEEAAQGLPTMDHDRTAGTVSQPVAGNPGVVDALEDGRAAKPDTAAEERELQLDLFD